MIVSFSWPGDRGITIEYDFSDCRVPVEGDVILATGTDPDFPRGAYEVRKVTIAVGQRGPTEANVVLGGRRRA